ncbi:hypothetical protein ACFRR7_25285, partial [Streptomyces sp. NPDC056909]|uniref:hypothetical protein n=1 Tax=Streptomyces sp. NPDC056909 TaxID=3345963 RepID=UPI00368CB822
MRDVTFAPDITFVPDVAFVPDVTGVRGERRGEPGGGERAPGTESGEDAAGSTDVPAGARRDRAPPPVSLPGRLPEQGPLGG